MTLRLLNTDNSSQWENRRDNAAAHGGCRHKSIHWSLNRQGPPPRTVESELNWTTTNSHRTEIGCSIGTLEMRTLSHSGNSKDTRNETTI